MTILTPAVSRYSLTVDAAETIAVMVDNSDNPWGRRLDDALRFATHAENAYPVDPYASVSREDFRTDVPTRPTMPNVAALSVSGVLDKLQDAGYITRRTAWRETSSEAYLSDGRTVTAVHVVRPFALIGVTYSWSTSGCSPADGWEITNRSHIVPAGWYLVGEVGDYLKIDLAGVAGMDSDRADWACWLDNLDGFGASHCAAGCQSCGAQWLAYADSWHFQADECDAASWEFDDADEIDEITGTVACPACGTGRVAFDIF